MSIQSEATEAARLRLYAHTVGVVNGVRNSVGTDPVIGLPGNEEGTGTGVAEFGANITSSRRRNTSQRDILEAPALTYPNFNYRIYRCGWEDLALVTVPPEAAGPGCEFFRIGADWIDPTQGETVNILGFPISNSVLVDTKQVGAVIHRAIALTPDDFSAEVLPSPIEDQRKYTFTSFNDERHYLIPHMGVTKGKHPRGFSGAAAWVESNEGQIVWTARFKFAGICTCRYKSGAIEQVVKASVVKQFLEEALGPE